MINKPINFLHRRQFDICPSDILFSVKMSDVEVISDSESGADQPQAAPGELFVPAKSKSDIWKYFKLKKDDKNKTWAVCMKCPKKSLVYCGGTTTLWNHAQQVHFIPKPKKSKQPRIKLPQEQDPDSSDPAQSTSSNPPKKQVSIEEAFARNDNESVNLNFPVIKTLF